MTIKQAFITHLPKDVSMAAVNNSCEEVLADDCETIRDALVGGFDWHASPEGFEFWCQLKATI